MALTIQRKSLFKGRILTTSLMALALMLQPFYMLAASQSVSAVSAAAPSTNAINKSKGWAHANETSKTTSSVTFDFVSTRAFQSCFEYRADGNLAQQESATNYNTEITDGRYPFTCVNNTTKSKTVTASQYVEVRMVFGAEKTERFDWERFYVAPLVCTYDFQAQKMWEITWGYGFEDRNGGAAKFTMQSNGGLNSLNGGTVPGYMATNPSWHWLYITEGQTRTHYDYGFADGTVRTADISWSDVNGCQVPSITWGLTENQAPTFAVDASTRYAKKLADVRFVLTDETGVSKSQVNIRNSAGVGVENLIRPNGASNAIALQHVAGDIWKLNLAGLNDNLPDGDYEFKARSTDNFGKTGYSAWQMATLDNVGPVVSVESPASGSFVKGTQKFVVNANDQSGMTKVHMYLQQDGFTRTYNMTNIGNGQWEYEVDTTTLNGDGEYFVVVRAVDALGNVRYFNNRHDGHFVIVDNTTPDTSISGATLVGNVISFNGSVSDANLNYYYCYLTTNQIVTVGGTTYTPGQEVGVRNADCVTKWASGQTSFTGSLGSFDVTDLPDGSYNVNLVAYDTVKNNNASNPTVYQFDLVRVVETPVEEETIVNTPSTGGALDEDTNTDEGDESEDDGESPQTASNIAPLFPNPILGFFTNPVTDNQIDQNDNEEENTNETDDSGDVAGVQDQAGTPLTDTGEVLGLMDHKWFGIAWYWFLVILAAIVGAWLMLAAAIRRNREEA